MNIITYYFKEFTIELVHKLSNSYFDFMIFALIPIGITFIILYSIAYIILFFLGDKYNTTHQTITSLQKRNEFHNSFFSVFFAMTCSLTLIYFFSNITINSINFSLNGYYLLLNILFAIIFQETYFYFFHRSFHTKTLFPIVHKSHHTSRSPRILSSLNFDIPEIIFFSAGIFIFIMLNLFLFGSFSYIAVNFLALYVLILDVYGHLGININANKYIRKIIFMPQDHFHHHRVSSKNYGFLFKFWDWIFNTLEKENIDEKYR